MDAEIARTRRAQEGTLLDEDRAHIVLHVPGLNYFVQTTLSRRGHFGDQIIPILPIQFLEAVNHEDEFILQECSEEADGGGARLFAIGDPIPWSSLVGEYVDHRPQVDEALPFLCLIVRRVGDTRWVRTGWIHPDAR